MCVYVRVFTISVQKYESTAKLLQNFRFIGRLFTLYIGVSIVLRSTIIENILSQLHSKQLKVIFAQKITKYLNRLAKKIFPCEKHLV